jgi:A/G-specific adenine glycosylase
VRANSKPGIQNSRLQKLPGLLLDWFAAHARDLLWRRTRDPYAIWVSEIMLQQTQVKTVVPYWERWMRELPTVEAAAKASSDKIHKLWEGLGYYTRARNLQKAAKQIVARQDAISKSRRSRGNETQIKRKLKTPAAFARLRRDMHVVSYKFPENFDEVLALPGIGRYTAGAICSIAFNQPKPILDGNVIRVLTRIFGMGENPREKETNARLWRLAEELVTIAGGARLRRAKTKKQGSRDSRPTGNKNCSHLNQSLMELGAMVCTPRNPLCPVCPAKKLCVAFRDNRVNELPNLGKRATAAARHFVAFVAERQGRFLVRQRPAGVVNAHLWEFPNVEIGARVSRPAVRSRIINHRDFPNGVLQSGVLRLGEPRSELAAHTATQVLGFTPTQLTPLCAVKHSITRYRITLEAFRVHLGGASHTSAHSKRTKSGARVTRPSEAGIWRTPAQMRRLAFTAAHKKLASFAANRILSG